MFKDKKELSIYRKYVNNKISYDDFRKEIEFKSVYFAPRCVRVSSSGNVVKSSGSFARYSCS